MFVSFFAPFAVLGVSGSRGAIVGQSWVIVGNRGYSWVIVGNRGQSWVIVGDRGAIVGACGEIASDRKKNTQNRHKKEKIKGKIKNGKKRLPKTPKITKTTKNSDRPIKNTKHKQKQ